MLGGCTTNGVKPDKADGETVGNVAADEQYIKGNRALSAGDYRSAIKYFRLQERRHPQHPATQQAQLETIYAYFKHNAPAAAVRAANAFIERYPDQQNLPYVYYLRGLALYESGIEATMGEGAGASKTARQSYRYFVALLKNFPESQYAADAKERMAVLRDVLASYETKRAAKALAAGQYATATVRAKYVLENYQNTSAIEEALSVLTQAYEALGVGAQQ